MTANNTPELTSSSLALQWEAARDEAEGLSLYHVDWDGEGANSVPFVLIQSTLRWFDFLEARGWSAPAVVYPTAGGTPVVEWYSADATSIVAYVRKPNRVDVVFQSPGDQPAHVALRIPARPAEMRTGTLEFYTRSCDVPPMTESGVSKYLDDMNSNGDGSYSLAA